MSASHEVIGAVSVNGVRNVVAPAGALIGVVSAGAKAWTKIPQGKVGLRTRFGRTMHESGPKTGEPLGVLSPGMKFVVPFTHSILLVDVRGRTTNLVQRFDDSGEALDVTSSFIWAISDKGDNPHKAYVKMHEGEELTQSVAGICAGGLSRVISDWDRQKIKQNRDQIEGSMREECAEALLEYGVVMRSLTSLTAARTDGQMFLDAMKFAKDPEAGVAGAFALDVGLPDFSSGSSQNGNGLHAA